MNINFKKSLLKYKNNSNMLLYIFIFIAFLFLLFTSQGVYNLVQERFEILEENDITSDVDRFDSVWDSYLDNKRSTIIDYSEWDDSYDYVITLDQDYIDNNYYWDYFEYSLGMNFIAIMNLDHEVLYSAAYDGEIGILNIDSIDFDSDTILNTMMNQYDSDSEDIYLIKRTEYGLMMFVINQVNTSLSNIDSNGYMVMGTLINQEVLYELQAQSGLDIVFIDSALPENVSNYFLDNDSPNFYKDVYDEVIELYFEIETFDSSENYYLFLEWDRETHLLGKSAANIISLTVFFALLLTYAVSIYFYIKIKNEKKKLLDITTRDHLTGLYNRRYYENVLISMSELEVKNVIIVMADINGLKLVNDAFGHLKGDRLIIQSSNLLEDSLNKEGFVARLGGDEFATVFEGNNEDALKYIKTVEEKTNDYVIEGIQLSISMGYALKQDLSVDLFDVARTAEDAMYRKKLLEIPSMRSNAIDTILKTLYEKDLASEEHSRRVSEFAFQLSKTLELNHDEVAKAKTAGLLHDIGKIIIKSEILVKDGKLTEDEYLQITNHPEIGFRILNSISGLREISQIVLCHHERWDGTGYPQSLKGTDIPLLSRILNICDSFDAMISVRSYRNIITKEEAYKELERCSGTQFDPELIEFVLKNKDSLFLENK